MNHRKCLPYIPPGNDTCKNTLPSDIPITSSGFCLLGSPIGSDCFREAFILDRIAKMQRALGRLGDLENSQVQTTLLRSYLSLLKPYRIVCLLSSRKLPAYLTTGSREPGRHLWETVARLRPTFPTNCGGRIFVLQFCMPQLLIPAQSQSLLT